MLIEFTVGNFLSIKNPVTFSMVAAKVKARDPKVNENNTIIVNEYQTLLKSAAIYGANASGKSNLIRALVFMRRFIIRSSRETQSGDRIPITPYKLSTTTEKNPSYFEIVFLLDGKQYRYGFETTNEKIISEWLFFVPTQKEATLFIRDENGIKPSSKFKEGKGLEEKTRPNALFLSVVAQFNGQIAKTILNWFQHFNVISGLDDIGYRNYTLFRFADGSMRSSIIDLVKKLDLGISDIFELENHPKMELPENLTSEAKNRIINSNNLSNISVKTKHEKWDDEKPVGTTVFDLKNESAGTQKLFYLAGPILDTLSSHKILAIDEMEARLHPLMTCAIIGLFNSPITNPNNSQLIFTTHDTNLLSNKIFRRDQIWFIEKDRQGASHLYSLVELKVRNDASFESDYFQGKYGAIPFLGDIEHIIVD